MFKARLKVCALSRQDFVEFEKDVSLPFTPFVGLAVSAGPRGEDVPLFVKGVTWSPELGIFLLRLEGEEEADQSDTLPDTQALIAVWVAAGWREARRMLFTRDCRRAAS